VHSGDPRTRLVAVPLHVEHDGDGRAAARLLRGRQYRHHLRVQPGADRAARGADRHRTFPLARRGERAGGRDQLETSEKGESLMIKLTRRQFTAGAAAATVAAPFGLTTAEAQNFGGAELIEAAKKEGKLVYYTADFTEPEQVIIKEFNRRFPFVKVEM